MNANQCALNRIECALSVQCERALRVLSRGRHTSIRLNITIDIILRSITSMIIITESMEVKGLTHKQQTAMVEASYKKLEGCRVTM